MERRIPFHAPASATYVDRGLPINTFRPILQDTVYRRCPFEIDVDKKINGGQGKGGCKHSAYSKNNHCSFLGDIIVIMQKQKYLSSLVSGLRSKAMFAFDATYVSH